MENFDHPSRREFVQRVAAAAGVIGVSRLSGVLAFRVPARPSDRNPMRCWSSCSTEISDSSPASSSTRDARRRTSRHWRKVQAPRAVIVGCADSRVAPELIFDQGIGDLFVVRIAGNVVSGAGPTVKGSIEYAVAELGARLMLVLGHSGCGACKAAIEHIDANDALPGAIGALIDPIRPVVKAVAGQPGNKLENVIKANVLEGVKRLEGLAPILSKLVQSQELKVMGGVYQLSTGKVEIVG